MSYAAAGAGLRGEDGVGERARALRCSCIVPRMRTAFRSLTSVLFAAIVVQVGFAGYGAFDVIHKAEKAPLSQKTIEDSFNAHGAVGTLIVLVMLALLIVSLVGRLGESYLKWSGGIFLLGILQFILGVASTSVPWLGFLHAVNALAIYAAVALLAHRVWTKGRATTVAPAATPTA
jgi:nicotinamide riboside transporter PnuC